MSAEPSASAPAVPNRKDLYAARHERFEREAARLETKSRLISNLRGLFFGAALLALLLSAFADAGTAGVSVALLCGIAFVVLVVMHTRVIEEQGLAARFAEVNADALARVTHRWHKLPDVGAEFSLPGHPFADDLDVFGQGSLYQRLCTARTRYGRQRLAALLGESQASSVENVLARQSAVQALSTKLEDRQELEALALAVVRSKSTRAGGKVRVEEPDPEPLLRWAGEPLRLSSLAFGLAGWLLPLATAVGALASGALGVSHFAWGAPLLLQTALALWVHPRTTDVFVAVSMTEGAFLTYGGMLRVLERIEADATLLRNLKDRVTTRGVQASAAMGNFRSRVAWFDLRHNGMVHPFAAVLLLWDLHCARSLEHWKAEFGEQLRDWFHALGELEALSALAGFAHDEPDFCYPALEPSGAVFDLLGLGHPLIGPGDRVANDVALAGAGSALLVTGSNMSGKSTLLRAMGLAAVLAQAGAPVCAKHARMSLFVLITSIRLRDSLEAGVSHFYAEIGKLKAVVLAAEQTTTHPVLFLLDEILHGTNSAERQVGARWVLARLLELGATGAISTHDLELCRLPDALMTRVRLVHFSEQVKGERMTFDYRLREGTIMAGNALRLMRQVGLDVPMLAPVKG